MQHSCIIVMPDPYKNYTVKWYESWFDSPYYHILYKNRDDREASLFIDILLEKLLPAKEANILDLACGRGRHARYLSLKGFNVTGIDLSPSSIAHAKNNENSLSEFYVHDMRKVFAEKRYGLVLNLFTSFGYFENHIDDIRTIQSAYKALGKNGKFVLDFLNPLWTFENITAYETHFSDEIQFTISKKIQGRFIIKNIEVSDHGKIHLYQEKVKLISMEEFIVYFEIAGFKNIEIYGDYLLNPFMPDASLRMIFIAEK